MTPSPKDPLVELRKRVKIATTGAQQYRISVDPRVIAHLLKEYDRLQEALGVKRNTEPIEHLHETKNGVETHAHGGGDIPHNHYGAKWVEPKPVKPKVEL